MNKSENLLLQIYKMAGQDSENVCDERRYLELCLEFAGRFGNNFLNFSVKIGPNFNFTVNHGRVMEPKTKRKYVSPSTRRRNNLRLLAFKARRAAKGGCSLNQSVAPPP